MSFSPIDINLPIEIDAGSFATALTMQGETVTFNHFNVPLNYTTAGGDPLIEDVKQVFLWKEDPSDQAQVLVDVTSDAIGSFTNGQAVIKALFKNALDSGNLYNIPLSSGPVYADGSARDTSTVPVKFYQDKDTHLAGDDMGSTLKSYLQEYLYDNLSKAIGLAATTGTIDIAMSRDSNAASEIIAEALASELCGSSNTEQGVAAAALRQNVYEQMFTLAPERFSDSSLMNRPTANDSTYKLLPFIQGDTLSFLVTFKFPAAQITAPIVQNALRTGNSDVYVDTGNKIQVVSAADATSQTRSNLSDFPNCTVMLRVTMDASSGKDSKPTYTRFGPAPAGVAEQPDSVTTGIIVNGKMCYSRAMNNSFYHNFGGPQNQYFRSIAATYVPLTSTSKVIIKVNNTEYDLHTFAPFNWAPNASPDTYGRFDFYPLLPRNRTANPTGTTPAAYSRPFAHGGDGLYACVLLEYRGPTNTFLEYQVAMYRIFNVGIRGTVMDDSNIYYTLTRSPSDSYIFTLNNASMKQGYFWLAANSRNKGISQQTQQYFDIYDALITTVDIYYEGSVGDIAIVDDKIATSDFLLFDGATGSYNLSLNLRDPARISLEMTPA
jgi:hypothetical protein